MPGYLAFDMGIAVLTTYDDDKFPSVQIDAYGEEEAGVDPYEIHSPHGLISRCHDPEVDSEATPTLGCNVLYAMEAGKGHAWLQSDPRTIPLLPPILKGGTVVYGGTLKNPSFININGETNSQTFYIPYKIVDDVAEKAMTIDINVDTENEESISIIHGSGAAVMITEDNGEVSVVLKNKNGDAYVEVNNEGIVLNGTVTVNGGLTAGGPAGALPLVIGPPLVALLGQLISIVAGVPSGTAASALAPQLATILAKNTNGL